MRADNTRHIIAAAQRRHELTRARAIQALRTLDADGHPVTFEAVAQAASVSRSWLYAQPDIRAEIERLRATCRRVPETQVPARQRSSDASLLRRLEAATQRIRQLAEENRQLREQLAQALGEQRATANRETASARAARRPSPVTSHVCTDCGLEDKLYERGRCERCAPLRRTGELLHANDEQIPPALVPIHDAITATPTPRTAVN